jgi:hypothetical protein
VPDDHERDVVVCDRPYRQSESPESVPDQIEHLLEVEGVQTWGHALMFLFIMQRSLLADARSPLQRSMDLDCIGEATQLSYRGDL